MKFFATFGAGQYLGALANSYIEFESTEEQARLLMLEGFASQWGFIYNEHDFQGQAKKYNLTRLVKLDGYGNVLERP